ncbi:hypothetical protein GQ600_9440 [Phytophthora cactorum]|nr:hypothetical protein GQ600_9440 [Phytophthora cactorum]
MQTNWQVTATLKTWYLCRFLCASTRCKIQRSATTATESQTPPASFIWAKGTAIPSHLKKRIRFQKRKREEHGESEAKDSSGVVAQTQSTFDSIQITSLTLSVRDCSLLTADAGTNISASST